VGRDCLCLFGKLPLFATSGYRQPLQNFPLTRSAKVIEIVPPAVRSRMWYMHDGTPAYFSQAVRNVLNNTYDDQWIGKEDPLHGFHARQIWFLPVRTSRLLCVFSSCWQLRGTLPSHSGCFSDYPQLLRHLWTDAAVHVETCRRLCSISWRTFWELSINVLFHL
jgi:hypothetical protein